MKKVKNLLYACCMLLTLFAGLVSCNTIQGAGEDIQRAGEEIEDAAD